MPRNEQISALRVPPLLVASATILFCLRIFLACSFLEQQPDSPVPWRAPRQLTALRAGDDKPIFYYFTASSNDSSNNMNQRAFLNRTLASRLSEQFVAVRVVDPSAQTPPSERSLAEALERRFDVCAFPTIIVALADGTLVERKVGSFSARSLKSFLTSARERIGFCSALPEFKTNPEQSARKLAVWLRTCNWSGDDSIIAAAYSVVGFRLSHNEAGAQEVLTLAESRTQERSTGWPKSLLRYLRGGISQKALFDDIDLDQNALTDAKFFAAMNQKSMGKDKEWKDLLTWIDQSGSRDSQTYRLAKAEWAMAQSQGQTHK